MHPIIHLGQFDISTYEVMTYLAFALAAVYMYEALKSILPIPRKTLLILTLIAFPVQYLGGAILPILYFWNQVQKMHRWEDVLLVGRFFHSVFLSVLVYILILCWWLKLPTKKILDHLAIAAMIMSSIGRIGCYLQGCCRGTLTTLPWYVRFPDAPGVCVHPTQLYMIVLEGAIAVGLWKINRHKRYDGFTFWIGVLLYSVYRFFIEFIRTNPIFLPCYYQGSVVYLTHAQVFSIVAATLSFVMLLRGE